MSRVRVSKDTKYSTVYLYLDSPEEAVAIHGNCPCSDLNQNIKSSDICWFKGHMRSNMVHLNVPK